MAEQNEEKIIYVIGVGPGSEEGMTLAAKEAIAQCTCVIGAKRLLASLTQLLEGKAQQALVKTVEITSFLDKTKEKKLAVLLSGDLGFYSGGKQLIPLLYEKGYQVETICGVSSLVYLCNCWHIPWEEVKVVSLHGREGNALGAVRHHQRVFFLTGNNCTVADICKELTDGGCGAFIGYVGENLSYEEERLLTGTIADLALETVAPLSVLLVENPRPFTLSTGNYGLPDDVFLRGNVPMTKEEIRSISLTKLRVESDSVVYDIGAGTGSVAVEIALRAHYGSVYAIEKNEEALNLLRANKEKFDLPHLTIVAGQAPEVLTELPAADRVFIGGSSGQLAAILPILLEKNPQVRVVINAITIETLSEAVSLLERFGFIDVDICQVVVSKARKRGNYHLMAAQNPVFIISGTAGNLLTHIDDGGSAEHTAGEQKNNDFHGSSAGMTDTTNKLTVRQRWRRRLHRQVKKEQERE